MNLDILYDILEASVSIKIYKIFNLFLIDSFGKYFIIHFNMIIIFYDLIFKHIIIKIYINTKDLCFLIPFMWLQIL